MLGVPWLSRAVSSAGDESDLILQVGESVVDRRGADPEHTGLHAFLDDAEPVLTGLPCPLHPYTDLQKQGFR